jgi:hypothetical protein
MAIGGAGYLTLRQPVTITTTQEQAPLYSVISVTQTATSTLIIQQSPLAANPASFLGDWRNTDPNAAGTVELQISQVGGLYQIHGWGACEPSPCDYGTVALTFYSTGVEGGDTYYGLAVYQFDFKTSYFVLEFIAPNTLQVTEFSHFTDASGRSDYFLTETFASG